MGDATKRARQREAAEWFRQIPRHHAGAGDLNCTHDLQNCLRRALMRILRIMRTL